MTEDECQKRLAELLGAATRPIVHLRAQYQRGRLGLVFGSGASKDLKFPDWTTLIKRLARHSSIDAQQVLRKFKNSRSLASVTQMLFNRFRAKEIERRSLKPPLLFIDEQKIRSEWMRILHHELYKDVNSSAREQLVNDHPYLNAFAPIISSARLTVNYNFDDTLEKLLLRRRSSEEKNRSRGYETTDKPNAQFQRENSIIYHPNGYLSSVLTDGSSANVVFADDAFQDQLIHAATGRYVHLSNHLLSNTCLLVGLSLEDATLQSLLRQNAVSNPGNVHYIVHYCEEKDRDAEKEQTIFAANFESFNLFTLFLDKQGIADLAALIEMSRDDLDLDYPAQRKKFVYYVVGSIGAGKSTAASNFRSLTTYDEWIDERIPELAVPEASLTAAQRERIDVWVAQQFRKKNYALCNSKEGVHFVDRCPLDPLTFGDPALISEKANRLVDVITQGSREIERGHIILLDCDLQDVMIRNGFKHKFWPSADYEDLIERIKIVYKNPEVTTICTRGRDQASVAKEIARIIFLQAYAPINVGDELKMHAATGVGA